MCIQRIILELHMDGYHFQIQLRKNMLMKIQKENMGEASYVMKFEEGLIMKL